MTMLLSERLEPLMENPGWQRVLMLAMSVLVLALMAYLFGLRGMWQQQAELAVQITTAQHVVSQYQIALLRVPSLKDLEREVQEGRAQQKAGLPLAQQFAQPLKDSGARLIRWQPAFGGKTEPQGELGLHLSFHVMTQFLSALLQRPEHPVFSELSLQADDTGLKASVLLTQVATGVPTDGAIAVNEARDTFAVPGPSPCVGSTPLPEWVLSGITHAGGQRTGWLLSPDGLWSKVESGSLIGTPQWTVDVPDAPQIELMLNDVRCGVQRQIIPLGKTRVLQGKENNEIR